MDTVRRGIAPELADDLRTEWLPDAIGGHLIDQSHPVAPVRGVQHLLIHTVTGPRSVPLIPLEVKAHLSRELNCHLLPAERRLDRAVCGYRDLSTPYRVEYQRFLGLRRHLAAHHRYQLRVDVQKFYSSVSGAALQHLSEPLLKATQESRYLTGWHLIPGTRSSRRLANLILSPVDAVAGTAFVRWQDDYTVFVDDPTEVDRVLQRISARLQELGLSLNEAKTTLSLVSDSQEIADGNTPPVELSSLLKAYHGERVSDLKFVLTRMAQAKDGAAIPHCRALVDRFPVLAPRIAHYLGRFLPEDEQAVSALSALAGEDRLWLSGRALAVFATSRDRAALAPRAILDEIRVEPEKSLLRPLAARVLRWLNEFQPSGSTRVDLALSQAAVPDFLVPVTETAL